VYSEEAQPPQYMIVHDVEMLKKKMLEIEVYFPQVLNRVADMAKEIDKLKKELSSVKTTVSEMDTGDQPIKYQ
jgi:hypothetical protein